MSGYSPGLLGNQGPPRAIQDPPPHEDRPNVEKTNKYQDSFDKYLPGSS